MACLCLIYRNPVQLFDDHYRPIDAARMLGIPWTKMLDLIKRKKFKVTISGKTMMISKEEIVRYAAENKINLKG